MNDEQDTQSVGTDKKDVKKAQVSVGHILTLLKLSIISAVIVVMAAGVLWKVTITDLNHQRDEVFIELREQDQVLLDQAVANCELVQAAFDRFVTELALVTEADPEIVARLRAGYEPFLDQCGMSDS